MRDRFTRGFIAGIIAAIIPFGIHFIAFGLKLTTLRYADWLGLFIFGHFPVGSGELIFTIIVQTCLLGGLGIGFAYLIPLFSSQNYWLKGLVYGATIWFFTYFITFLFKIPELIIIPLKTATTNLIGGCLWGVSLGIVLNWLDDRLKQ